MTKKPNVAILLATYNSSRFIREQLDSLFRQTYKNWKLYVRDDGSLDDTLDIVNQYKQIYGNIIVLDDTKKNQGAKYSFLWLLSSVDSDYYMFCDHDDVWIPEKISVSLDKMNESEFKYGKVPIIVNTDLYVVDQKLNIITDSFWRYSHLNDKLLTKFNYLAVNYFVTGCTMFFNNKVKEIAFPIVEEVIMHDAWLSLITLSKGGVITPVHQPTIYYRQHFNNVYGAKELISDKNYYCAKFKKIASLLKIYYNDCKVINKIKPYPLYKYLLYKILYLIKR